VSGNGWKETFKNDVDQARRQAAEETSGVHAKNNGRLHPQFKLVRFNDIEPDNTRPYLVKGLRFFADWAAKKWPLRGSLQLAAGGL